MFGVTRKQARPFLRALLTTALFASLSMPAVLAAELPSLQELISESKSAHKACREGKASSLRPALDGSVDPAKGGSPEQEAYDVFYYDLNMKFDRVNSLLVGDVSMTAEIVSPIDICILDCYWMLHVDSVYLNNTRSNFITDYLTLPIPLHRTYQPGEKFSVRVFYHAFEEELNWWNLHFGEYDGRPVIGNLSEPFYARAWWPCKDHPNDKADSLDIKITYPSELFCASNGIMISDTDLGNGFRRTHWSVRYPITTYLVSVAIAEFTHWREWALRTDTDSLPVDYWVYPGAVPSLAYSYSFTVPAIDTLSRLFGKYPFANEKYAMSSFIWGGAMEHQTNTSMTPGIGQDIMVVVHELAHQWWGDMITCRDWHHSWLNEGFATYSEALFVESYLGAKALAEYMDGIRYLSDGAVYRYDTSDAYLILDGIVYDKGAWVLHMLRGVIGDEAFFTGLRAYGDSPLKYGTAVTEDFQFYMEQSSSQDLEWFFHEWIYESGFPIYGYRRQCTPTGTGAYKVDLIIEQQQPEWGLFEMPVQVSFASASNVYFDTLWVRSGFEYFQLEFSDSITAVTLDPNGWILKLAAEQPLGLTVVTRTPPAGRENKPYHYEFQAIGGKAPYTWSFLGGDLPYGVDFEGGSHAVLDGVPSYAADYYFTLQITDASQPAQVSEVSFAVTITPKPHYGDCDANGIINMRDIVYIINYVFVNGPEPIPLEAGDANCNDKVTISDAVYLINYIYMGGPAPCWGR